MKILLEIFIASSYYYEHRHDWIIDCDHLFNSTSLMDQVESNIRTVTQKSTGCALKCVEYQILWLNQMLGCISKKASLIQKPTK